MKKYAYTLTAAWLTMFCVQAQTNLELANEAFQNRDYVGALTYYRKVLEKPDKKTDLSLVKYNVAECYRYTGRYEDAITWYNQAKAEGYNQPNYLYHQANLYIKQGKYEQALQKIESFLSTQPGDKDALRLREICRFAMTATPDSSVFTIRNEQAINSAYNDYAALRIKLLTFLSSSRIEDKSEPVYTFDGQGFSDIYVTAFFKEDKTWSKPRRVPAISVPEVNEGVMSWCEKTRTVYFTRCNDKKSKDGLCKIYEAVYDENTNTFQTPKPISLSFTQKYDMQHPAISADGSKLYFSARADGGMGGADIWFMRRSGDVWGEPVNLGSVVNTEWDEVFPTLYDSLLIFASDGHPGYGALDIFYSIQGADGWTRPVNMKPPFNSSADDFYLFWQPDGKGGYFTSNRPGGAGGDDIYSFYLTPIQLTVKGRITDQETGQPLAGATVILTAADGWTDSVKTNADGEYSFALEKDKNYKINVQQPGYFGDSRKLSTAGEKFSKEFSRATGHNYDFAIKRIPKEEIRIDNIYYDLDSYVLREESKPELDKLVKILEDTPDAIVQINSHTDERGSAEYNQKLSENRARSVVEYLVSKGISEGRLRYKGFGFTQPVVKGAKTEEEHQRNRRTAFQVIQQK
ncbi:MAG: OmpA family protein [Chitinophagales bacterium]|nr:OmpA family protein [Chitinophagales bacterium]MDW8417955.1 OmpA family protein [Chitinophagales bacterium]